MEGGLTRVDINTTNEDMLLTNKDVSDMVVRLALTAIEVAKGMEAAEAQASEFFNGPEDFDSATKAVYELGYAHGMRALMVLITGYLQERIAESGPIL